MAAIAVILSEKWGWQGSAGSQNNGAACRHTQSVLLGEGANAGECVHSYRFVFAGGKGSTDGDVSLLLGADEVHHRGAGVVVEAVQALHQSRRCGHSAEAISHGQPRRLFAGVRSC